MSFTLKHYRGGGLLEERTLANWNLSGAEIELGSGEVDTLSLETSEALNVTGQWLQDDTLELWLDNTRRFAGKVVPPHAIGAGRRRSKSYEVQGPGRSLERIPFTQNWIPGNDPDPVAYGRAFLFANNRSTADEMTAAAQRAIGSLPVGAPLVIGTIDAAMICPPQKIENATCAQVFRRALARTLDATAWWEYAVAGHPALWCRRFADLETVAIAVDGTVASRVEYQEAWEQRIPYVRVILKRQIESTDPEHEGEFASSYTRVVVPENYFAEGATGTEEGGVNVSCDWDPDFTEIHAATAAATVLAAANNVAWQGLVTVVGALPNFAIRPGVKLNLTGAGVRAELATMNALVQRVRHDLFTGTTTARFGPPAQLGFHDLEALIKFWAGRRPRAEELDERDTGYSDTENFGFGKDGSGADEVGVEVEFTVASTLGWVRLRQKVISSEIVTAPGTGVQIPKVTEGTPPTGGWLGTTPHCPEGE